MQEIKTYADITKAANAMQKEREIQAEIVRSTYVPDEVDLAMSNIFAQLERIFGSGYEVQVKPVNTSQAMFDAGFKWSDF